ncbi:MAG: beta-lactamase family protein [Phycisphaerales bacterium]|nr:beta-lactamase family protein [Phycisphaerales bacterium]
MHGAPAGAARRLLLASLLAAAALACGAEAARAQPDTAPRDLSDSIERVRVAHDVPALAVAAVRGGEIAAQGAAGVRRAGRGERVTIDDRWHIGSCAKSMTATLAARLVEAGAIRWETTIGESLGAVESLRDRLRPAYDAVTLRQLLSHRAGLPEDRAPDPTIWPRIMSLRGTMIEQRRAATAIVLAREPASAPGSAMAYSNLGYVTAASMMEQATGRPWEDLIRAHLFEPLHITTAGFGPPGGGEGSKTATEPRGHRLTRDQVHAIEPGTPGADNPPALRPAGGVHLSLQDWCRYAAAHAAGARGVDTALLKAESWEVLHTDEYGQGYALGWGLGQREWAGGRVLTHSGSNGLWMAVVWIAPERDLAIVAATNIGGDSAAAACDEAVVEALKALDVLAPPR